MTLFPARLPSETSFPAASASVNAGAALPSRTATRSALLPHERELRLFRRLPLLVVLPSGFDVVRVGERERRLVHVAVHRRLHVPSPVELEVDRARVARANRLHVGLVPLGAVVRHHDVALV